MTTKALAAAVATALAALALSACDRTTQDRADRDGAQIAQKANSALAATEEKLKEAGHVAKEKLDQAGEKTSQALSNAGAKTDAAVHDTTTRVATSDTTRDTRGAMGDAAITASIKTDFLKDPDLSVLKIDVDTRDGVVTLQGLADNDNARTRAERMAQGVKGVKEVRNYLVTKKPV
jgi:hyperosmotically inducible protein